MTRPDSFEKFIGNKKPVAICQLATYSAMKEVRPIPHHLFLGPAGTGKTTLARIIARTASVRFTECIGNDLTSLTDIQNYAANIGPFGIWFVDEIHRVPPKSQDIMLPLIEDFNLQDTGGLIKIPPFTLVAATTRPNMLDKPFVDRFPYKVRLALYSDEQIVKIIHKNMGHIVIDDDGALLMASYCRGTPRIAVNFCRGLRDYAVAKNVKKVTAEEVSELMILNDIHPEGLTGPDVRYLLELSSGKKSKGTMSAKVGYEFIEDTEICLLQKGFMEIGSGGRSITKEGANYIRRNRINDS